MVSLVASSIVEGFLKPLLIVSDVNSDSETRASTKRGAYPGAHQWHRATSCCTPTKQAWQVHQSASVHSEVCDESCLEALICLAISSTC